MLKFGGFAAGLGLAALALLTWQVPAGSTTPGAAVSLTAVATGELGVSPAGAVLRRTPLRPSTRSGAAETRVTVRNQTASELDVFLRAPARTRDLDAVLRVEIEPGGRRLFAGSLRQLRDWTRRSFRLGSGTAQAVRIRAWIPKASRSGYEAGVADMTLEFHVRPARTGS